MQFLHVDLKGALWKFVVFKLGRSVLQVKYENKDNQNWFLYQNIFYRWSKRYSTCIWILNFEFFLFQLGRFIITIFSQQKHVSVRFQSTLCNWFYYILKVWLSKLLNIILFKTPSVQSPVSILVAVAPVQRSV